MGIRKSQKTHWNKKGGPKFNLPPTNPSKFKLLEPVWGPKKKQEQWQEPCFIQLLFSPLHLPTHQPTSREAWKIPANLSDLKLASDSFWDETRPPLCASSTRTKNTPCMVYIYYIYIYYIHSSLLVLAKVCRTSRYLHPKMPATTRMTGNPNLSKCPRWSSWGVLGG